MEILRRIRFRDFLLDLERRYVPVRKSGRPTKTVWMTYRAMINKALQGIKMVNIRDAGRQEKYQC